MKRIVSKEWGVYFEPRDMWVGVYWKPWRKAVEVYVCLLPMLPLRVYVQWE